jgi:hypothetical protein
MSASIVGKHLSHYPEIAACSALTDQYHVRPFKKLAITARAAIDAIKMRMSAFDSNSDQAETTLYIGGLIFLFRDRHNKK